MKELTQHLDKNIKTELNVKKQKEIEYVLEGSIKPKKGQRIWEVNTISGEVIAAQYKQDTVSFNNLTNRQPEKLIVKSGCIYIPSINAANAKKKYLKNKNQDSYYVKKAHMSLSDITF